MDCCGNKKNINNSEDFKETVENVKDVIEESIEKIKDVINESNEQEQSSKVDD